MERKAGRPDISQAVSLATNLRESPRNQSGEGDVILRRSSLRLDPGERSIQLGHHRLRYRERGKWTLKKALAYAADCD